MISDLNPDAKCDSQGSPNAVPMFRPGPPPASTRLKESQAKCYPLCPKCRHAMVPQERSWKCGSDIGCKETSSKAKWCVEFMPRIPTYNQKGKLRHNQTTYETWPCQKAAEDRVADLRNHFRGALVTPSQQTPLSAEECRAAEHFFLYNKFSLAELTVSERLIAAVKNSRMKSPQELIDFITAHDNCGIPCSLTGMLDYCTGTKWPGDLAGMPTFVEAVQKVRTHQSGGFDGGEPISEAHEIKSRYQDSYIMAWFQPNYPEPTYPDLFTDQEILRFVTYSYDTPRKGMPPTEMEKWRQACAKAEGEGRPLPSEPIEEPVFKLVEDGKDAYGNVKWKKVPGELEYPRPWPRSLVNSFIIRCRAVKNAMARETLCGEPAKWTRPAGETLKTFKGSPKERAAEAIARVKRRRVLTTSEKIRILYWSLVVDGGIGAPSVIWQGWGGGRRADVEKYCKENLNMLHGRIQVERWQNKNGSCKDVSAMLNFYIMADFLIRRGLWTEENFKYGFSDMTRMRILTKAGFWEESWDMSLSKEDKRAGEDFEYQPFEPDDILDLPGLVELVRQRLTPRAAFIWNGLSETEQTILSDFRSEDKGQEAIRDILTQRLNVLMAGPLFYSEELFVGVTLKSRTADLFERNPTGPNLRYLKRLLLEDMFPGLLANRQRWPGNGLRRSGMSAFFQVYESKDTTITYFSTGGTSWEEAYKTFYSKPAAREHWQVLYPCMDKLYGQEDRSQFLPPGHKLDDFRTPFIIEAEQKNAILAEEIKQTAPPAKVRRRAYGGKKHHTKYTPEQKAEWVEKFQKSGMTQKAFAEENGLVFGVFHRWLEDAGVTRQTRTKAEIEQLLAEFQASDLSRQDFAESKLIPPRTFWTYLEEAGLTDGAVKHSSKQIAEILAEFSSSEMTQKDFAKKKQMHETTLRGWLAKSKASGGAAVPGEEVSDIVPGRKMTDEQVAALIAEYDPDQMTQEEFAKSKGIGLKTLHSWLKAAKKTKQRRTKEQIAALIAKYHKSGMTNYAFAMSIGIAPGTLYRWLNDCGETE